MTSGKPPDAAERKRQSRQLRRDGLVQIKAHVDQLTYWDIQFQNVDPRDPRQVGQLLARLLDP